MSLLYNRFSKKTEGTPGEKNQPLTLYQLNRQICEALEDAFPKSYWVIAEIAEVNRYASGHCYLTLIDKEPGRPGGSREQAKAKATIWRDRFLRISQQFEAETSQPLKTGLKILLNATVKFHELHGLSLDILHIDPTYTIGDLARQRQETLARLQTEGLLEQNKQLPLPLIPQRLAIVSSPTAAGLQDFLHQLHANVFGYEFVTQLFPATVQGKEAVAAIIHALAQIGGQHQQFDAIVIIRGGGSQTDLYCFDQYELAAAVANAPLPVLTGIGHERDETITDLVAHTRFKTPTAVAAFLIERCKAYEDALDEIFRRVREEANSRIKNIKVYLERQSRALYQLANRYLRERSLALQEHIQGIHLRQRVFLLDQRNLLNCHQINLVHNTSQALAPKAGALREAEKDIREACHHYLQYHQVKLLQLSHCVREGAKEKLNEARLLLTYDSQRILFTTRNKVSLENHRLELKEAKITLHDPQAMLLRGYTLTYCNGRLVKSATDLAPGDVIETKLAKGKIHSTITQTENP